MTFPCESSAGNTQPFTSVPCNWKTISCGIKTSPCTDRIIYLQFSKNLSPNQLITYINAKNHLWTICLLEKKKVPQIELGSDYSERKQQLETIWKSDSFKAVFQGTSQMHFSSMFPSISTVDCWDPTPPARLTRALSTNTSMIWEENLWCDLIWVFQIHETGSQKYTGTVIVETPLALCQNHTSS